jgi:hypothetical protein
MYNTNIPEKTELPTNGQLIKATLASLVVAIVLLVSCILPAEYAIDPTGIGKKMGLLEMGEIKVQLEQEAYQEEMTALASSPAIASKISQEPNAKPTLPKVLDVAITQVPEVKSPPTAEREIQLNPGEAAELKLVMKKNNKVQYKWSVNKGHVNFDTHGDNPLTNYHGYGKGKAVTSDDGTLTAAFDGKHGWFWRNRSSEVVSIKLEVSGDFQGIERVL